MKRFEVGWALLVCALSACKSGGTCPANLITDPTQALALQNQGHSGIRSLRAEAKVDQRGKEGRIKGRVMMFVERPDHVRLDAVTQFGPALVFTSDGGQFALSDFKADRYFTGPACPRNIARIIGVALSGPDVANVLLGESPLLDAQRSTMTCEGGAYRIERTAADGARQELALRVNPADTAAAPAQQRLYLASATFWDGSGRRLYRVEYDDYRLVAPGKPELPFTVQIQDFVNDADALLHFQSIDLDVNVPADAFVQTPRAGLGVEEVRCE